jgi:uncharacterized membrane protein YfcA
MIETVDLTQALMLIVIGFIAGGINTFAGGGSNLSLPALMMVGLPADVANATNRVAVFMQSVTATRGYYVHGKIDNHATKDVFLPLILGGLVGAVIASSLQVDVLKPLLLATMIAVSFWVVFKSDTSSDSATDTVSCFDSKWGFISTFLAGFYGGFIQAGVGFVLIAVFVGVLKHSLLSANILKIVATLIFTSISLAVFIYNDQIAWLAGIYLAIGSILGAMISVKFSLDIKPKTLKILVLVMTVIASIAALLT